MQSIAIYTLKLSLAMPNQIFVPLCKQSRFEKLQNTASAGKRIDVARNLMIIVKGLSECGDG